MHKFRVLPKTVHVHTINNKTVHVQYLLTQIAKLSNLAFCSTHCHSWITHVSASNESLNIILTCFQ